MRIGWIGVGNMGRPMVMRLAAAGFAPLVYDVNSRALAELAAAGISIGDSPAAIAAASDVVCTSLPGPIEVEGVILGENGVCQAAKPGMIYIDFSTNSPLLVRKLNEELQLKGSEMLDAPVSGGVEGAQQGTLTVLVGGKTEVLARVRPLFETMAKTIMHVGDIGAASICKVLHNCAVFCANLATMECLTVGVKAGVDASTLISRFPKLGVGTQP